MDIAMANQQEFSVAPVHFTESDSSDAVAPEQAESCGSSLAWVNFLGLLALTAWYCCREDGDSPDGKGMAEEFAKKQKELTAEIEKNKKSSCVDEKAVNDLTWLQQHRVDEVADDVIELLIAKAKEDHVLPAVYSDPRVKPALMKFINEGKHHEKKPAEVAELFTAESKVLQELKEEITHHEIDHLKAKRKKKALGVCTYGLFCVGYTSYAGLNCSKVKGYAEGGSYHKCGAYSIFFVCIIGGAFCALLTYGKYCYGYGQELAEVQEHMDVGH